ncbi:hypothetical protein PIROE2DRAFT_11295 [Piromyces sp. E2]|nr:hypothetical protein PIROE2DRAFT_11295 [Piromyces sp. E2]|eukprot:OUM62445.1 hypothetical protein PIROE2DRAFT_11295 [Piromyces sp. E2]
MKVFSKEYSIKKDNINEIPKYINENNENNVEVKLYFENGYYNMKNLEIDTFDFNVDKNISFIGRPQGTRFDFGKERKGAMKIVFIEGKGHKLTIENIIFENYKSQDNLFALQITIFTIDFYIEINNCIFRNSITPYIAVVKNTPSTFKIFEHEHILINNCSFLNNNGPLTFVNQYYKDSSKDLIIRVKNSNFSTNNGIIHSSNSKVYFDNCYFSNIQRYNELFSTVFFASNESYNDLEIRNTVFENIDVNEPRPILENNRLNLM